MAPVAGLASCGDSRVTDFHHGRARAQQVFSWRGDRADTLSLLTGPRSSRRLLGCISCCDSIAVDVMEKSNTCCYNVDCAWLPAWSTGRSSTDIFTSPANVAFTLCAGWMWHALFYPDECIVPPTQQLRTQINSCPVANGSQAQRNYVSITCVLAICRRDTS